MDPATQWYIDRETRKVENQCSMAMQQIRRARNLREVVQANHVHVQPYLRSLVRSDVTRVHRAMEEKATEIIDQQLADLAAMPYEERKAAIGRMMMQEWNYLRGNLPSHFHRVEMEQHKLLHIPKPVPPDAPAEAPPEGA